MCVLCVCVLRCDIERDREGDRECVCCVLVCCDIKREIGREIRSVCVVCWCVATFSTPSMDRVVKLHENVVETQSCSDEGT